MKLFSLCILFLLLPHSLCAIYPIVRNFGKAAYKAGTQNWAVAQHPGGCVYFANNNGLLEFDGREWGTYPVANYTNVRSLYYDTETERLYAGAFNEFGYYEVSHRGAMVYRSLMPAFAAVGDVAEIWRIHKADGSFYLQSNREIYKYSDGKVQLLPFSHKVDCSAVVRHSLLASTKEEGILILAGGSFLPLPHAEALRGKKICAMLPYEEEKVLFVTDFHGVFLYDGQHLEPWALDIDAQLRQDQVFCAATDGKSIAFGTVANGLFVRRLADGATLHVNTLSGLQNNTVLSLAYDNTGNLWLGLDKGIDYVAVNTPEFSLFGSETLYGSGYASRVSGQRLYLGTNQGLYYMQFPFRNGWQEEVHPVAGAKGQVWSLTEIDHTLFCCHDRGIFLIEGHTATRIPHVGGTWRLMPLKHHPELLLGCSYEGLFFLRKRAGRWEFSHYLKGFPESSGMFAEGSDGTLWMTHWMKGLYRLRLNAEADSVDDVEYFGQAKGFPTDRNNLVSMLDNRMVFSSDAGFYKFDLARDRVVPLDEVNALFTTRPAAVHIHESPHGDVFFLSGTLQALLYTGEDGRPVMDSTSLAFLQDKRIFGFEDIHYIDRDNLLFSTENGFSWINLAGIKAGERKQGNGVFVKHVYLTGVHRDSLVYSSRSAGGTGQSLQLPYRDNSLRFEFVAPEYEKEAAVEYSYLLEEYDAEWSLYSTVGAKEYAKLPWGKYVFRVRARNRLRSEVSEAVYHFEVLPPWYLSPAAYSGYVLLCVLLGWGLVQLDRRRTQRRAQEMERRKEEEMCAQQLRFEEDAREREKEIVMLKNQTLEYDLRHKSQDLATSTMNLIRKNEILCKIQEDLNKMQAYVSAGEGEAKVVKLLGKVQKDIRENIGHDDDWQKFATNFDVVYDHYLRRLGERFPQLTVGDKRLCAYLKMDLCSKDIAPLLNMSVRSVEMARYRLRKKMGLSRDINLVDFLQHF